MFHHKYQRIAFAAILLSYLFLFVWMTASISLNLSENRTIASLVGIVILISIFVLVFSEEKVEDEMIRSLRLKAIAKTAGFCFCFAIALKLIQMFLPPAGYKLIKEWSGDLFSSGGMIVFLSIIYFILFKRSTRRNFHEE